MKRTRKRTIKEETPRDLEVKEVTLLPKRVPPPEVIPSLPTKPVKKVYTVDEAIGILASALLYVQEAGIYVEVGNFKDNLVVSFRGLMVFQDTPKSFRIIPRKDVAAAIDMRDAVLAAQKNVLPKKDAPQEIQDGRPASDQPTAQPSAQLDSNVGVGSESGKPITNPSLDDQRPGGGGV